jgi:hypothetical protein
MSKGKKPSRKQLLAVLFELNQWAVGNRGRKEGNPYGIQQISDACVVIAAERGISDKYDWNSHTEKMQGILKHLPLPRVAA